ncbi:8611_t:CDS:2 [Diversispora eburnea]|uniref:8611_t:CDS:1 n=1 Tax=Diversispora eburnea TaxID=1213867 RepID=A0A9N8Z829_9GLOM|nr:8611_t:CDS:2 [Diversispora eburnea]
MSFSKMPPQVIKPSNRPNEEYTILQLLGRGSFGMCFQVENQDGEIFALKVIEKQALGQNYDEVLNETNIHNKLKHPHIVNLYDVFDDTDFVYFKMELCSNQSLFEMVRDRGELTESEVRLYMLQLIDAVGYMHDNNIMHRDLKPENIFLSDNLDIKIGDFGLSTELDPAGGRQRTACGTLSHMAPEILTPEVGYRFEADVWAIGVIIPFSGHTQSMVIDRILNADFEFPSDIEVSHTAKNLISGILNPEYGSRLTLSEIRRHFFFRGPTPIQLPISALRTAPNFDVISKSEVWAHIRKDHPIVTESEIREFIFGSL